MKIPTFRNYEGNPVAGMPHIALRTTTELDTIIVNQENTRIVDYAEYPHMNHLVYRANSINHALLPQQLGEGAMERLIKFCIPVRSISGEPSADDREWYDEAFLNKAWIKYPTHSFDTSSAIEEQAKETDEVEAESSIYGLGIELGKLGIDLVKLAAITTLERGSRA